VGLLGVVAAVAVASQPLGYEDELVQWGLSQVVRVRDSSPDGKQVDEVLVVSENVFSQSDPFPTFLNIFHWRTKEQVIRREVLLAKGEVWNADRALETERNLRRISVLAVAKVVPCVSAEGQVTVLVVTKDRWSLRLNNSFTLIGSLLQFLRLQLTETNFRGLGQSLSADMILRLDTVQLGQTFIERRLFNSRWYFGETASVVLNRQSGAPEGTAGSVVFALPLVSLSQPWGFSLEGGWNLRRRRVFRGASIWQLPYEDETGATTVPQVYDVREVATEAHVTRSFGLTVKTDVTGGVGFYMRQYIPPTDLGLTPAQRTWLQTNWMPRSEAVSYGLLAARWYPADFRVFRNIEAFELSEDYQVGPLLQAGVRYAFPTPLTPNHFVEVGAAARWRAYVADDLLSVSVSGAMRIRLGDSLANQRVAAEITNYSPRFYGGRFVTRLLADFRFNDLDNRQQLLGGSSGLRGTLPEQFTGKQLLLANVEYRTRSFTLATFAVGFVLFYDVGSAFDSIPRFTHTLGAGLRLLLPQFNQEVIRIDIGAVLGGPVPGLDRLNATFGQVNDFRPSFLEDPLGRGESTPP
jgi:hypothetical protein